MITGKVAVFPIKQTQISNRRVTLNVTVAQDYCWMWTNKGSSPISLTVYPGALIAASRMQRWP